MRGGDRFIEQSGLVDSGRLKHDKGTIVCQPMGEKYGTA
jgi:hypothetical protein